MKKLLLVLVLIFCLLGINAGPAFSGQTVHLNDRVDHLSMALLEAEVVAAHRVLPIERPIIIKLNSPGGSVFAGYKFMNKVRSLQLQGRKFVGVVTGFCASMCFNILQALDMRASLPFGMLMQHLPRGGDPQALEAVERAMDRMIAARLGVHVLLWKQVARANLWVDPQDALSMNVIDAILIEIEQTDDHVKKNGEESRYINVSSAKPKGA